MNCKSAKDGGAKKRLLCRKKPRAAKARPGGPKVRRGCAAGAAGGAHGEAEAPGARKAAYAIAAPEPGTGGCAYPVGRLPYTE